ncbi:carbon-nitrogen family hydrolase [Anaerobacillus sp. MEB173]|uniref:carbon-nitrogen family hydrolase n=1 Tax=Anaerobacillus sp. MEB173 TaxID=3383345 RepID=UPI003F8F4DB7
MKISVYQMDIVAGNPEENRKKVKAWAEKVVKEENSDTLVLPEMWTTAYTLEDLKTIADDEKQVTIDFLSGLASEHQVNIIGGSIAQKVGDKIYNRAVVFNRSGELIYQYDKIHLVPMLDEHLYLEGGQTGAEVFELEGVKMGLIICYDMRFPELARSLALEGAQVLFILAEWPSARVNHWKALQIARAIENQMYIVSANRVGVHDGVEFCGHSMFVDPWGDVLLQGTENKEETLTTELDLQKVLEVRENVPVFMSRVSRLYKYIN